MASLAGAGGDGHSGGRPTPRIGSTPSGSALIDATGPCAITVLGGPGTSGYPPSIGGSVSSSPVRRSNVKLTDSQCGEDADTVTPLRAAAAMLNRGSAA